MTNKYKNKIKKMNFLSQSQGQSKRLSINKIRENYRDKETNENILSVTRGSL